MSESFDQVHQQFLALYEAEIAGQDIADASTEFYKVLLAIDWNIAADLLIRTEALNGVLNSEASECCVYKLMGRHDREVFDLASQWCGSSFTNRRCYGARILGQLHFDGDEPHGKYAIPIVEGLLADQAPEVVDSALHSLGHLVAGDLAKILPFCSHARRETRFAAALALLWRTEPQARSALVFLSGDIDDDVRDWATFGLGATLGVDSPEIRSALAARLADAHYATRCEAIKGLAVRRDERVIPAIVAELQARNVGNLVFEACAVAPDARYTELLEDWAKSVPGDEEIDAALAACRTGVANEKYR